MSISEKPRLEKNQNEAYNNQSTSRSSVLFIIKSSPPHYLKRLVLKYKKISFKIYLNQENIHFFCT